MAVSESIHFTTSHAASTRGTTASEPSSDAQSEGPPKQTEASTPKNYEEKTAEPRLRERAARIESPNPAERETSGRENSLDEQPLIPFRRAAAPAPKADPSPQYQLAEAVAKVFEQTKTLQVRFDELTRNISKLERIGDEAARAFEPLRSFHAQLAQLAASFEPMRAFQTHLAQLADNFEPMKVLHDQLAQLADSFQQHLAQLVKVLDPAKEFRDRTMTLAHSFDEAIKLQADFSELYTAFRASSRAAVEPAAKDLDASTRMPH